MRRPDERQNGQIGKRLTRALLGHVPAAHGATPWLGENAILRAVDVFRAIQSLPFASQSSELFDRPSINLGRILGGDASFYYVGSYTSENGRWKGQILNQEHTPAMGENPIFGGHEVGIGFSGTCDEEGALLEATALAGKRSLRMTAVLKLMRRV